MNQKTTEISTIISAKETLAEVGRDYLKQSDFDENITRLWTKSNKKTRYF